MFIIPLLIPLAGLFFLWFAFHLAWRFFCFDVFHPLWSAVEAFGVAALIVVLAFAAIKGVQYLADRKAAPKD